LTGCSYAFSDVLRDIFRFVNVFQHKKLGSVSFFDPTTIPFEVFVSIVQVEDPPPGGGFNLLGDVYDFSAFDADGSPITDFGDQWVELTLSYDEGSPTEILYYDDESGWVSLYPPFPPFDPAYIITDTTITGYTNHFTLFAISGSDSGSDTDVIPEPGTFVLIGLGLLGVLALARRRHRQK
jgi:hypothetical protein